MAVLYSSIGVLNLMWAVTSSSSCREIKRGVTREDQSCRCIQTLHLTILFLILEFWAYISHDLLFQRILFINHNSLLRTFSLYLRMLLCFLTIASLYLVIIYIAQLWLFSHNSGRTFHNSDLFPHNCNSSLNSDFFSQDYEEKSELWDINWELRKVRITR